MHLTSDDRVRFAEWCRLEANSNKLLAEQLSKIGNPIMDQLSKKKRIEAQAALIVEKILTSSLEEVIGTKNME
jgi:hypothetical protein